MLELKSEEKSEPAEKQDARSNPQRGRVYKRFSAIAFFTQGARD